MSSVQMSKIIRKMSLRNTYIWLCLYIFCLKLYYINTHIYITVVNYEERTIPRVRNLIPLKNKHQTPIAQKVALSIFHIFIIITYSFSTPAERVKW